MTASSLTPLLLLLTVAAWLSCLLLGYFAIRAPRIGALSERTFIALAIAALGTVASLIVLNTDGGHPLFDAATASILFRCTMLVVLAIPSIWLVLYVMGRLGPGGKG
jgi:hypothetical protein